MSSATDAVSPSSAKMHLDKDGSQMDIGGSSPAESQTESVGSVPESSSSEDFSHSDNSATQSESTSPHLGSSHGSINGNSNVVLVSGSSNSGISSQSNSSPPSKRSRLDNTDEPGDIQQIDVNNDAPAEAQPEPIAQELDPTNRSSATLSDNSAPISSNHTSSGSHPADESSISMSESQTTSESSRPGSSTSTAGPSSVNIGMSSSPNEAPPRKKSRQGSSDESAGGSQTDVGEVSPAEAQSVPLDPVSVPGSAEGSSHTDNSATSSEPTSSDPGSSLRPSHRTSNDGLSSATSDRSTPLAEAPCLVHSSGSDTGSNPIDEELQHRPHGTGDIGQAAQGKTEYNSDDIRQRQPEEPDVLRPRENPSGSDDLPCVNSGYSEYSSNDIRGPSRNSASESISSHGSNNGNSNVVLVSGSSSSGISSQSNNGPPSKRSRLDNTDEPADSLQMDVNNDAPAEAQPEPVAQELDPTNRSSAALSDNSAPISSNCRSSDSHLADESSISMSESQTTSESSRPGSSTSTAGSSSVNIIDLCAISPNSIGEHALPENGASNGEPSNGPSNDGANSSSSNSRAESSISISASRSTSESSRPGSEASNDGTIPANSATSPLDFEPANNELRFLARRGDYTAVMLVPGGTDLLVERSKFPRLELAPANGGPSSANGPSNEGANSSSRSPVRHANLPKPRSAIETSESSMSTDDGRRYLPLGKRTKWSLTELLNFADQDESDGGIKDVNGPEFEQAPPGVSCRRDDNQPQPPPPSGGVN